jgi:hypothetical protein
MWGDQLARQWRVIGAIEAGPDVLIVAEVRTPDEAQGNGQERKTFKSLFQKLEWAFLLWGLKPVVSRILF